jgi:hypothetical protein
MPPATTTSLTLAEAANAAGSDVRMTAARKQIYDVLAESRDHPTATDVFLRVKPRIPGISLATVYNNLEALTHSGLIKQVNLERMPLALLRQPARARSLPLRCLRLRHGRRCDGKHRPSSALAPSHWLQNQPPRRHPPRPVPQVRRKQFVPSEFFIFYVPRHHRPSRQDRRQRDPQGSFAHRERWRSPRHHGPERLRQEHARERPDGQPELHGHEWRDAVQRPAAARHVDR